MLSGKPKWFSAVAGLKGEPGILAPAGKAHFSKHVLAESMY
jgi:hypothetical protein